MCLVRDGYVVALLIALLQTSAFASLKEDEQERINLVKVLAAPMDAPLINGMQSVIRDLDSSSSCAAELLAFTNAAAAGEIWALRMLDASSKIQSGILNGNIRDLGMYGQCIRASGEYNNIEVKGKHCSISFVVSIANANMSLTSAICIPSTCDPSQVIEIVTAAYESLFEMFDIDLALDVTAGSCARIESEDFTVGEILTVCFFTLIAVFILSCTICDFVKRNELVNANSAIDTLSKFSLWTNAQSILSTKITPGLMPALQGMRFFCMCWIVLGHRYVTSLSKPTVNFLDFADWFNTWDAVFVQAGLFAVDTFFVLSGFLMTYQYLRALQSGRKLNIPMMYIHRYLRLTPSLAVMMLFIVFLLHRISNGPIWNSLNDTLIDSCEKNWWVNLLFVQNYVNSRQICLMHSWYLAVDMQLFWISPIILFPLYRWPKYGFALITCVIGICMVIPAVVLAVNDYSNVFVNFINFDPTFASLANFYIVTHVRAGAYFVGVLLGFEVANHQRILRKATVTINWIIACIAIILCGWINHYLHRTDYEYNKSLEIACAILLRPIWSVATAWIAYACTQGYGGFVTTFLSAPIFLPLSRLSYCIYLVHMVLQFTKNAAVQIPGIFLPFSFFNEFLADLLLSIGVAFFLSLFFESPVIILEKLLRNRGRRPNRPVPVPESKKDVEVGSDNRAMNSTTAQ